MDTVDRWRESIPEESRVETGAGAALVGVALAVGAFTLLRGRRGFLAWAIPGAILGAGLVMLADVLLDVRTERIEETADLIESELEALDPIARAQVLKSIGERQVEAFMPGRG
ncbi:MAG: hypothetical protein JXA36_04115 [Coriobacteriia bacterium]|nr:hypothetical protein [Coriobacteriia bacterium]